jgi:ribonucleotide reductase beta subunit family protein with ferritin-like domain
MHYYAHTWRMVTSDWFTFFFRFSVVILRGFARDKREKSLAAFLYILECLFFYEAFHLPHSFGRTCRMRAIRLCGYSTKKKKGRGTQ